jgi:hypothetical protein
VLEQMPRLAQAIADGMGIPFGKLREKAKEGKLEAEAVFDAILSGAAEIETEFGTLNATVAGLGTVFGNEFTRAVAELDKVVGVSEKIKSVIIAATNAVRFFGENIGDWAFVLGSRLLIGKVRVIAFTEDVKDALGNLFSGSIDGTQLAETFIASLEGLKEKIKTKVEEVKGTISEVFSDFSLETIIPEAIDLSKGLFTNLGAAIQTVSTFVGTIISYFYELWRAVSGNSFWPAIFDPSREKDGKPAIGNTEVWKGFLNSVAEVINNWKEALIALFQNLYNGATKKWSDLVNYVNNLSFDEVTFDSLPQNFNDALSRMREAWSNFTSYLTTKTVQTPGGPEEVETNFGRALRTVGETWDKVVVEMETRWGEFYGFLTTKEIDTPAGIKTVETQFGVVLRRMEVAFNGFFQKVMSFGQGTEALTPLEAPDTATPDDTQSVLIEKLRETINNVTEATKSTPIFVGVKLLIGDITESLTEIKDTITGFFEGNANIISASITTALALALNKPLRGIAIRGGIIGAFLLAAANLGDDEAFLAAVRDTASGFGEALGKFLSEGEGDIIGDILSGLGNIANAIGTGLLEGLFGTEFEEGFSSNLATAVGLAIGAFIINPAIVLKFVKKLLSGLFGNVAKFAITTLAPVILNPVGAAIIAALAAVLAIENWDLDELVGGWVSGIAQKVLEYFGIDSQLAKDMAGAFDGLIRIALAPLKTLGKLLKAAGSDSYTIADAITDMKSEVGEAAQLVVDAIKAPFIVFFDYLEEKFNQVKDFLSGVAEAVKSVVNTDQGSSANRVKSRKGFATGGYVSGPGTATSDSIPAMLSDGEFVMKASAVRKFGAGFMARINAGIMPQKFGDGGLATLKRNVEALEAEYEAQTKADNWHLAGDVLLELRKARERYNLRAAELAVESGTKDPEGIEEAARKRNSGSEDGSDGATRSGKQAAENFANVFASSFKDALKTGDFSKILPALADEFTSSIIDQFVDGFTNSLFEKATAEGGFLSKIFQDQEGLGADLAGLLQGTDGEGGIFEGIFSSLKGFGETLSGFFGDLFSNITQLFAGGGGGGGGFLSTAIGFLGKIFAFSQGGIVPSTPYSQAGKDSVPAMLMPGEVVLSKNDVARQAMNQQQQQQVFNINVSGDVTRQTRQEIVKMMPQITAGVNNQNREQNFKSR